MKLSLIAVLLLAGCSGAPLPREIDSGTFDAETDVAVDAGTDTKKYNGCTETCDGICTCPHDAMNCVSICGQTEKHCMPYVPNGEGCPSGYDCNSGVCKAVEPALPPCGYFCSEACACPGRQSCQQYCGGNWLCEDPGHLIDGCPAGYACINPEGCIKDGTKL